MGYREITNLYKNRDILLFKECYALEKIHGTSAHINWRVEDIAKPEEGQLTFFSGGEKYTNFIVLFDHDKLKAKFIEQGRSNITIYGEAYGGRCQRQSHRYGKQLKFIAFEVLSRRENDYWFNVPAAEKIVLDLGLEFVSYNKIPATIEALNAERDMPSVQAVRNGMGTQKREGIVVRPLEELCDVYGGRIMAKHKGELDQETRTPRELSVEELQVLNDAQAIAEEWATENRLEHVLQKLGVPEEKLDMSITPKAIVGMIEDIHKEATGEIVQSEEANKAIGKRTAQLLKARFQKRITG